MPDHDTYKEITKQDHTNQKGSTDRWLPFILLVIFGAGLIIGIVAMAANLTKINKDGMYLLASVGVNVLIFIAIVVQAYIYKGQWQIMDQTLKQTDDMFYAANRAYIGVTHITPYDPATNKSEISDSGKFRIDCTVVNKGKTPAVDFGHVFRGIMVEVISPSTWPQPPAFDPIDQDRIVPQILPEAVETLRGDEIAFLPEEIALINSGHLLFVVSCKFVFNCLGMGSETYIAHYIWSPNDKAFFERKDWPPKTENQES